MNNLIDQNLTRMKIVMTKTINDDCWKKLMFLGYKRKIFKFKRAKYV